MGSQATTGQDPTSKVIAMLSPFGEVLDRCELKDSDWQEIWRFCGFHGVRPALAEALQNSVTHTPPKWFLENLTEFMRQHTFAVLQKTGEIIVLARALEAAGIQSVFFKGAVLGVQAYGGAQNREFNDIDLLVAPRDGDKAADLLEVHGYQPVIADRQFRRTFFDHAGQHMFCHRETGIVVDLHWNFVGSRSFPVGSGQVLDDRTQLTLGGHKVPAPSHEDLALILAGHGQKEGWASFGWALDFARFAAIYPQFDWTLAEYSARARGSSRAVMTALLLVEALFGKTIDANLVARARAQDPIARDVANLLHKYATLAERKLEDDLMGGLRLCETPGQRVRVWLGLLTTRTIGDYEAMPLPPGLWGLYLLTRPFRLGWRRLSGRAANRSRLSDENEEMRRQN